MNEKIWENHLKYLSGGYQLKGECIPLFNHLEKALKFMQSCNIDSENKLFLDVGCNNDYLKNYIKSEWNGIDFCKKNKDEDKNYIEGDIHSLPYPDKFYDIVFSSHALEHTLAPIIVLAEIKRVLKDDGDIIIALPIYPYFIDPDHNYLLTSGGWEHIFVILKLEIIKKQEINGTVEYHLKKCKI